MQDDLTYGLTCARLHLMRKEYNEARVLLEELLVKHPTCQDVKRLLLQAEKELTLQQRRLWEASEDSPLLWSSPFD